MTRALAQARAPLPSSEGVVKSAKKPVTASDSDQTILVKLLSESKQIHPSDFELENHYYPRVLNATIHPLVASFFSLGHERIIARYTHLNPQISVAKLQDCLKYQPTYFRWAGSDLFNVTTASGHRQMIVNRDQFLAIWTKEHATLAR